MSYEESLFPAPSLVIQEQTRLGCCGLCYLMTTHTRFVPKEFRERSVHLCNSPTTVTFLFAMSHSIHIVHALLMKIELIVFFLKTILEKHSINNLVS